MPHWKSMMDRDFIYAFDLNGKDVTVKIARVVGGELTGPGGRKSKKPVIHFEGKEKGLALNSTNCKTIAALYGNYTEKWVGRSITLYGTTTQMGGETVECIRIRPQIPRGTGQRKAAAVVESEPEPNESEVSDEEAAEIARLEAEANGHG